jgi:hypothetical protein
MSTTFKQNNVVVGCSPTFEAQGSLAAALALAKLTSVLPLSSDNRPLPNIRRTREETRECRGRYLIGRRVTSRLVLWTVRFTDVSAQLVTGILALAMGEAAEPTDEDAPHGHDITHGESDDVAKTSFTIGTEGDDDEPIELYKGMCVNRVVLTGEVRGKVSMDVEFCGSADIEIIDPGGYNFAACQTFTPVYTNDCQLLINAIDRTADLRRFQYTFNNNLFINDDPFIFDSVDAARIERNIEDSVFNFGLYGTKAHAVYADAEAETTRPVTLRIGTATEGASIIAAGAQLALQDTPIGYAGEANRSVINFDAVPFSVDGAAPDRVHAVLAQADRFLAAPA